MQKVEGRNLLIQCAAFSGNIAPLIYSKYRLQKRNLMNMTHLWIKYSEKR